MAYKIGDNIVIDNDSSSYLQTDIVAYKYKTVLAYGYVAGGYEGAEAWTDIGRVTNSTDQTIHIGAVLDGGSAYNTGASTLSTLFIFGTHGAKTSGIAWDDGTFNTGGSNGTISNGYGIADTYVEGFNMMTETMKAHHTKFDMARQRNDVGVSFKEEQICWIMGGYSGTDIEKMDLTNETMLTATPTLPWVPDDESDRYPVSSLNDQYQSYVYGKYGAATTEGSGAKFNMTSETFSGATTGSGWGAHGQQKGINSKDHKGWAGNEGSYSGGYNMREWNLITDSLVGTFAKVLIGSDGSGEENYTMGQDHCYMLGVYGGVTVTLQSNDSMKFTYATNAQIVNPAGLSPSWQDGMSSAACGWRA